MRLIDADALTEFLKCLLPERGMWEIEGDTGKNTVCETVAEAIEMVKNMETIQLEKAQLSQEGTTSDLISRQEALDALQKCRKHCIDPFDSYHIDIQDAENQLSKVPTVQPERKKGEWIEISSINHTYKCSECGRLLVNVTDGKNNVSKHYPYCHCGADMRGEQQK